MKGGGARRERLKRAREWVYLTHFLAATGVRPDSIISGKDDGKEPDFTCIIGGRLVGIELTTLPRLRDNMGDKHLWLKRLYWRLRSRLVPVRFHLRPKQQRRLARMQVREDFFNQPLKPAQRSALVELEPKLIRPSSLKPRLNAVPKLGLGSGFELGFLARFGAGKKRARLLRVLGDHAASASGSKINHDNISYITQYDMDSVMEKKAHKAVGYQRRRKLDELWLLVHTDFYQENHRLYFPKSAISHDSDYHQVWLTSYPLVHAYPVQVKRRQAAA